jgi:hypothetical protein
MARGVTAVVEDAPTEAELDEAPDKGSGDRRRLGGSSETD